MSGYQPIPSVTPVERDDQIQAVVLAQLITWLPAHLTEEEIIREVATDPSEFPPRDEIQRAIRDLVKTGLAHRYGPFVIPTRTALRHAELTDA